MTETTHDTDSLFVGEDAEVRDTYDRILEVLRDLGPFEAQPKKTSIHLAHSVGFAGIHPRKTYLYLNLRSDRAIDSPRVVKTEQVSKNRYHTEIKLSSPDDVDAELVGWLGDAFALR